MSKSEPGLPFSRSCAEPSRMGRRKGPAAPPVSPISCSSVATDVKIRPDLHQWSSRKRRGDSVIERRFLSTSVEAVGVSKSRTTHPSLDLRTHGSKMCQIGKLR